MRKQAGLSRQQVADGLGMSQAACAWWKRNTVALRPEQLQKLPDRQMLELNKPFQMRAQTD